MQKMYINNNIALVKTNIAQFDALASTNFAQQNFKYVLQCEKYENKKWAQFVSNCILVHTNNTMYYLDNNNKLHKCTFAQAMQILTTTFVQL